MREILFRGKVARDCVGVSTQRKYKKGTWVFGDLSHTNYDPPLIDQNNDDPVPVDPSTVGQYTGRTDKNGKRVFEGDICLCDRNIAPSVDEQTFQILFDVEAGQWVGSGPNSDIDASQFFMCEVIRSVHDNPELLEGGQNDAVT